MFGILAFIIGGAAGIGIAYSLLENRLSAQKESLENHHRQTIEELEKNHQLRLDRTVEEVRQQAIADTQQQAQSSTDDSRAQVTRPETEPVSQSSSGTPEADWNLEEMRTLVAQESRVRQVTLAQRDKYQTNAQEAVRSLPETPEAPEDPPVPYAEISIPPSASGASNPPPPSPNLN